jgi:hypothetical protein
MGPEVGLMEVMAGGPEVVPTVTVALALAVPPEPVQARL